MKRQTAFRRLDALGRIVLPAEYRRQMDINIHDNVEIYVDHDTIRVRRYKPSCIFCGKARKLTIYNDKPVCSFCIAELLEQAK